MVTIRTYSNAAEAAMAKSLLDNHDIFCRLADENVNLYGGGPLAMPIRLLVAEDQAQEAERILETKGPELPETFDTGTAVERQEKKEGLNEQILSELRGLHHANQWLFVMMIALLVITIYWSLSYLGVLSVHGQRLTKLWRNMITERRWFSRKSSWPRIQIGTTHMRILGISILTSAI
jgi:hypothetical protein